MCYNVLLRNYIIIIIIIALHVYHIYITGENWNRYGFKRIYTHYVQIIAKREARQIIVMQCFLAWRVCMYVTLLQSMCMRLYMQWTRGLVKNSYQKKLKTGKQLILSIGPGKLWGKMSQEETSRCRMRLYVQCFRKTRWDQRYMSCLFHFRHMYIL